MISMCCLVLNRAQMLRVLAATRLTYLATLLNGRPILMPLWYEFDIEAEIPAICLRIRTGGRLTEALRQAPQVCMAFSLLQDGALDSVLAWGQVEVTEEKENVMLLRVPLGEMTGRRFLLRAP